MSPEKVFLTLFILAPIFTYLIIKLSCREKDNKKENKICAKIFKNIFVDTKTWSDTIFLKWVYNPPLWKNILYCLLYTTVCLLMIVAFMIEDLFPLFLNIVSVLFALALWFRCIFTCKNTLKSCYWITDKGIYMSKIIMDKSFCTEKLISLEKVDYFHVHEEEIIIFNNTFVNLQKHFYYNSDFEDSYGKKFLKFQDNLTKSQIISTLSQKALIKG